MVHLAVLATHGRRHGVGEVSVVQGVEFALDERGDGLGVHPGGLGVGQPGVLGALGELLLAEVGVDLLDGGVHHLRAAGAVLDLALHHHPTTRHEPLLEVGHPAAVGGEVDRREGADAVGHGDLDQEPAAVAHRPRREGGDVHGHHHLLPLREAGDLGQVGGAAWVEGAARVVRQQVPHGGDSELLELLGLARVVLQAQLPVEVAHGGSLCGGCDIARGRRAGVDRVRVWTTCLGRRVRGSLGCRALPPEPTPQQSPTRSPGAAADWAHSPVWGTLLRLRCDE